MVSNCAERFPEATKAVALRAVLNYLEDEEDARIAEEALDEHYRTGAKTILLEEVAKKLGLEG